MLHTFIVRTAFRIPILFNFPALIGKIADGQKVRLHVLGAPALQKRNAPAFPEIQPESAAAHLHLIAVMLHDPAGSAEQLVIFIYRILLFPPALMKPHLHAPVVQLASAVAVY